MKFTIRIPTSQYAYIEAEVETKDTVEAITDAIVLHNTIQKEYSASLTNKELTTKEWNSVIDRYLTENRIASDDYEKLSNDERIVLNEIKKSLVRIANKTPASV